MLHIINYKVIKLSLSRISEYKHGFLQIWGLKTKGPCPLCFTKTLKFCLFAKLSKNVKQLRSYSDVLSPNISFETATTKTTTTEYSSMKFIIINA